MNDGSTAYDWLCQVNTTRLHPCNATNLMDSVEMQFYVDVTGDWDGVTREGGVWFIAFIIDVVGFGCWVRTRQQLHIFQAKVLFYFKRSLQMQWNTWNFLWKWFWWCCGWWIPWCVDGFTCRNRWLCTTFWKLMFHYIVFGKGLGRLCSDKSGVFCGRQQGLREMLAPTFLGPACLPQRHLSSLFDRKKRSMGGGLDSFRRGLHFHGGRKGSVPPRLLCVFHWWEWLANEWNDAEGSGFLTKWCRMVGFVLLEIRMDVWEGVHSSMCMMLKVFQKVTWISPPERSPSSESFIDSRQHEWGWN